MSERTDWYCLDNPENIDSPALLVYPERVEHNIRTAINMAGSAERLRPHVKTSKSSGAVQQDYVANVLNFNSNRVTRYDCIMNKKIRGKL